MVTLKDRLSVSKISTFTVEDLKKYGVEGGTYKDKNFDHRFLLVKIPSTSAVNKEGKTIKGKPQMAYYDTTTGKMGIGPASDFFALLPETLPTLDKVIKWKEREANLSGEDKMLLIASIEHKARIEGRRYKQEEKEQVFGFLIKNESLLKQAIRDEKKYQSLSRTKRALFDQSKKARVAEIRRHRTRGYVIEKKNTRKPHAWGEVPQRS